MTYGKSRLLMNDRRGTEAFTAPHTEAHELSILANGMNFEAAYFMRQVAQAEFQAW